MVDHVYRFIWDPIREIANIKKHGVNFLTAAKVFQDPKEEFLWISNIVWEKKGFFVLAKLVKIF